MGNVISGIVLVLLAIILIIIAVFAFVYNWPLWSKITTILIAALLLGFGVGAFCWPIK
jgi:hypothetical protein